eukprot:TRINITY_DN696_c0_g1_i1.p1 TRINITY_DN696_c0_g1~~TRINITY_DN696_c0_g1_i1.p1  ORF type:complete len:546 (+),score=139.72 TRINITY_DN696_c0_g1_i1:91-1728(+)
MNYISCIAFAMTLCLGLSAAYDTGHHSDLTRNGLMIHGFSSDAQTLGAVANWMVDYFSYTVGEETIEDLKSLHFDNLYHLTNISNYFTQLVKNTMNATQYAVSTNDPVTYITMVGMSLHAVQDFYTHSSWAEHHQTSCGCYRDDTFAQALFAANGSLNVLYDTLAAVRTYSWGNGCNEFERNCLPGQVPHGGYCEGINKDSYVRPWFERSYGHAMAATIEWIYNIENWANAEAGGSDLVAAAKSWTAGTAGTDLASDYKASITVSYATKIPLDGENDGHYKGAGSGDFKRFATAATKFYGTGSSFKQLVFKTKVYQYLTYPNLYDVYNYGPANLMSEAIQYLIPYSDLPEDLTNLVKIKVRTTHVNVPKSVGRPSPYAIVTMSGLQFIEAVQHNMEDFKPHWTSILYAKADVSSIPITYELWNDRFPGSDEQKKVINDADGNFNLNFSIADHVISGDIQGTYDTVDQVYTSQTGDATVSIYITTNQVGKCVRTGLPEPFCPSEAYTELRDFSGCGTTADPESTSSGHGIIVPMMLIAFAIIAAML